MPLTPTEVRANLRDMVNSFIKDEAERAGELFHQVLQAKMQAKINPQVEAPAAEAPAAPEPEEKPEGGDA